MAELERYLDRLRSELPLPASDRDEAVEEIAAHAADATADLVARGVPAESAERRVLSRFGPPERLADSLAAARRGRWQLATAMGAALRTGLRTGFWALAVGWLTLYITFLAAMSLARWIGGLAGWDLSTLISAGPRAPILVGSVAMAVTAYAVGRALPAAVSVAARRRLTVVKPWVLGAGAVLSVMLGLFVIEATFEPLSATLTAALPLWFALGVVRPRLLPSWYPGQARATGVVLLLVAVLIILPLGILSAAGGGSGESAAIDAADPIPSYSRIAPPSDEIESMFTSTGAWSAGHERTYEFALANPTSLAGWQELRLEVWLGRGPDNVQGVALVDPSVDHPLASRPVVVDDAGSLSVTVELPLIPERDHYLAALVGTSPEGERRLLSWPQDELARWTGSVWEYLTADRPW